MHEGDQVREFYSQLLRPVLVGIEATGSMHWFLNLMDELGIECWVGHRRHDSSGGAPQAEKRFPAIWLSTKEPLDLRALQLHRHHWVRMRTRIQNAL